MNRFNVTFEIVTPESAARGDCDRQGFMRSDGGQEELPAHVVGKEAGRIKADCAMRLRQAIDLIGMVEDTGPSYSFQECDPRRNYQTGHEERRAFHPPYNVTPSSAERIARLLRKRRLLA